VSRYAEKTSVSVENSRGEIERTLSGTALPPLPTAGTRSARSLSSITKTARSGSFFPCRTARPESSRIPQAEVTVALTPMHTRPGSRRAGNGCGLAIKAKLEAVAAGITTFEDEFRAHIVLPDGSTFGLWARPQIAKVYEDNTMPSLLALGTGES
jgi:hypothetical protein